MVDIGPEVTWAKFGPIWSKNLNRATLVTLTAIASPLAVRTLWVRQKLSDRCKMVNLGILEIRYPYKTFENVTKG